MKCISTTNKNGNETLKEYRPLTKVTSCNNASYYLIPFYNLNKLPFRNFPKNNIHMQVLIKEMLTFVIHISLGANVYKAALLKVSAVRLLR